jgi:hypothetical protein
MNMALLEVTYFWESIAKKTVHFTPVRSSWIAVAVMTPVML